MKYYYIFEKNNKHYDPTCRIMECSGDTLANIQAALDIATRASESDLPPLVVSSLGNGEFIAINNPLARTLPSAERYKIVPFDPSKQYKRHKIKIDKA